MIEVADALRLLLDATGTLPTIEAPLDDALGRFLAEPVHADRDAPPTDRSAMDGFAIRAADGAREGVTLAVVGEVRAGQSPSHSLDRGEAVRIFTGAVIPEGADAVVMVEHAVEDRAAGTVRLARPVSSGQNVRRRGEDRRAGEPVLLPGVRLGAAEIAALAATGHAVVRVVRPPQVSVLSTGDEIVAASRTPAPHQVRNSNAAMLLAQARALGATTRELGIAGDESATLDAALSDGLSSDLLIVSGGVSVGVYDLVAAALGRRHCRTLFHNVSMRPGKPILAAVHPGGLVLGLPGNPVSAFTGFHVFAAPAVRRLSGDPAPVKAPLRATLEAPLIRRPGRPTYHLASLRLKEGRPWASEVASASSGDVLSLSRANAFIVAPGGAEAIPAGSEVDVLTWG